MLFLASNHKQDHLRMNVAPVIKLSSFSIIYHLARNLSKQIPNQDILGSGSRMSVSHQHKHIYMRIVAISIFMHFSASLG